MNVKSGDKFTAKIGAVKDVKGAIQIQNGIVFLCQDSCEGKECVDKLGYKHSWVICRLINFNEDTLSDEGVVDFVLLSNRKSRIESLEL